MKRSRKAQNHDVAKCLRSGDCERELHTSHCGATGPRVDDVNSVVEGVRVR